MMWKDEYSVGLEEIDSQHKELLDLFSRLMASVNGGRTWSEIHFRIVELRNFADFHFEFEEALMRMFDYPGIDNHANSHRGFFDKLDAIERTSILNQVQDEIIELLFYWLSYHIMSGDKAYAKHILSTGIRVKAYEGKASSSPHQVMS